MSEPTFISNVVSRLGPVAKVLRTPDSPYDVDGAQLLGPVSCQPLSTGTSPPWPVRLTLGHVSWVPINFSRVLKGPVTLADNDAVPSTMRLSDNASDPSMQVRLRIHGTDGKIRRSLADIADMPSIDQLQTRSTHLDGNRSLFGDCENLAFDVTERLWIPSEVAAASMDAP